MSDFLPEGYEMQKLPTQFLKFKKPGKYQFRIMSKPVIGWVYYDNGKAIHVRKKEELDPALFQLDKRNQPKEFWTFIVYNREEKQLQSLELTQHSIKEVIKNHAEDEDWGSPVDRYDFEVTRKDGEMVSYDVKAKPHRPTEPEVLKLLEETKFELDRVYEGKNVFINEQEKLEPGTDAYAAAEAEFYGKEIPT